MIFKPRTWTADPAPPTDPAKDERVEDKTPREGFDS